MPYVKKTKVARITFGPGHRFEGLELRTKTADLGFLGRIAGLFADFGTLAQAATVATSPAEGSQKFNELGKVTREIFEMFATKLISWDYQVEGTDEVLVDVPPTVEGMQSIEDTEEVMAIINEWLTHIGGVNNDLGKESSGGETSPALSQLMEPLSLSQAS